jgi:predicted ATPase
MIVLAREHGFTTQVTRGTILRGWALAEQGQTEEGSWQIQRGVVTSQARSAELGRLQDLILLAEAHGKAGRAEEGLSVLAEAPNFVEKTKERNYEAELYRLKGELTLAQSGVQSLASRVQKSFKSKVSGSRFQVQASPKSEARSPESEAEECFLRAIEVAQKQQAKSLELRATMSLARLWQQQGKHQAARNTLSAIYNWFTEGFDTKELQEAKALLVDLAGC